MTAISVLVILQGMDASGKDGAVRHIMSGVNPQAAASQASRPQVLKKSTHLSVAHAEALPPRGTIGIFNRSHYEEVLIVRVHEKFSRPRNCRQRPWARTSGDTAMRTSTISNSI